MTKNQTMEKKQRRNRYKKHQPTITYKKSRKQSIVLASDNARETFNIHKTVYLPDFDDFESMSHIDYRDIRSLLGQ